MLVFPILIWSIVQGDCGVSSGPVVGGFAGEDRGTPESLLAPNVSPDALNVDYRFGLLGRRPEPERITIASAPLSDLGEFTTIPGDPFYGWDMFRTIDDHFLVSVFSELSGLGLVRWFAHELGNLTPVWKASPILPTGKESRDNAHVRIGSRDLIIGAYAFKWVNETLFGANPFPVNHSPITATAGGSGGLDGYRRYLVVRRDSADGSESILEDLPVENGTAAASEEITVTGWATGDLAGDASDEFRIYATATSSSPNAPGPFYFLADIPNTQASYVDDTPDGTLTARQVFDSFRGEVPEQATDAVVWQDRLFVSTFNAVSYSERYTGDLSIDGMPAWCRMFPDNFLGIDSPFESIADAVVSDAPRGIVRMVPLTLSQMLVFTSKDLYVLEGTGPGSYRMTLFMEGMGTPARNTIQSVGDGVVYLHPRGIVLMSRGGSFQIFGRDEMALMGVALDDNVETYRNVAGYDGQRHRYMLVCQPKDSPTRMMVVVDLTTGVMSRWDVNAQSMLWSENALYFFGAEWVEGITDFDGYIWEMPEGRLGIDGTGGLWHYRTPRFALDGDPATQERAFKFWMWFRAVDDPPPIQVEHYGDGVLQTEFTLDPTQRVDYALLNGMAREHWFVFRAQGGGPVAIERYQIQIEAGSAKEGVLE